MLSWVFLLFICVLLQDGVMQAINESTSDCAQPALVQQAYRMGGPVSSLSYSLPLQVLQPRSDTSLTPLRSLTVHIHMCAHRHTKLSVEVLQMQRTQTLRMVPFPYLPQTSLLSGCQDSISWRSAVLCYYQRRALSSCFIHVQGQDQTVCGQTERDLQPREIQWWEVAFGQWTHLILIICISILKPNLCTVSITVSITTGHGVIHSTSQNETKHFVLL